jgi:hypothetical protein
MQVVLLFLPKRLLASAADEQQNSPWMQNVERAPGAGIPAGFPSGCMSPALNGRRKKETSFGAALGRQLLWHRCEEHSLNCRRYPFFIALKFSLPEFYVLTSAFRNEPPNILGGFLTTCPLETFFHHHFFSTTWSPPIGYSTAIHSFTQSRIHIPLNTHCHTYRRLLKPSQRLLP